MKLTATQQAAVEFEGGHLQLIACAGSGKTEVVARRIARILDPSRKDRCEPRSIVAFTFTERAAAELEARVHRRAREAYGAIDAMVEMYIGTLHSFCRQLLQDEVAEYLRCSTIDAVGQHMLVAREPDRSGFALASKLDGEALSIDKDVARYLSALDVLRQGEVDRTQLGDNVIGEALERYRALLRAESALDYTAQLELALDLIRRDVEVGNRLASRLRHIIVDEYQDTNPLQERVVRALAEVSGATLTVVGDDDQTIYGFNGADIDNILTFDQRYRGLASVHTIRLEENFRSSDAIVSLARGVAHKIEPRLPKAMIATGAQPSLRGEIGFAKYRGRFDEARAIGRKILSLRGAAFDDGGRERGLSWSDFAVLFRQGLHYNANELLKVFDEMGIPFVVTGRKGLLVQRECRALRATIALFATGADGQRAAARSLWVESELCDSTAAIDAMLSEVLAMRSADTASIQSVLLRALDVAAVRERSPDDLRFANVGRFSALLGQFERTFARVPIAERAEQFVAYCDRSESAHEEASGVSEQRAPDAVRVSTVHSAKGLQWPCVFLPRLEAGQFPSAYREPSQWSMVAKNVVRSNERYETGEPEERRLFYVAVTRAQRFLFASAAGAKGDPAKPSAFFDEIARFDGASPSLDQALRSSRRLPPAPRTGAMDQRLTFSELKPMFECPYRFALQARYGFTAPHDVAEGFGASLHNALAEVHRRAIEGDIVDESLIDALCERHLHLPYADEARIAHARASLGRILARYLRTHRETLGDVELVEKAIRVHIDDGIAVEGRIDLVIRRDVDEHNVVDLKSAHRAQSEELTELQLLLYALGYEELTRRRPAHIERWELDTMTADRRGVDDESVARATAMVRSAASLMRGDALPARPEPERCERCGVRAVCASRAASTAAEER